jgi:hypothetical protein
MILLTNLKVDINNPNDVYAVVERYLTRWKCDECFRYIKQSYNLEDVRLLPHNGVRNITVLVHAIADGIYELLKYTRTGIDNIKTKIGINPDSFQLSIFPELEPI